MVVITEKGHTNPVRTQCKVEKTIIMYIAILGTGYTFND